MTLTDPAAALHEGFSGQMLRPAQPGYDEARQVFNAMIDRRPALIARPADTADVAAAVDVARNHGLVVAVRCGGHSVAGLSTCDDGLLIDLSGLKSITVDPEARTVRAGGGVLWGELDAATQAYGLHTPGGRVTTTGIGGFTTGGGYGWTSCTYGLACDNLIAAEVVLADGRVVRASEDEHANLFWGIRGGGGNFGIVTEFTFRLHPLGPTVLAGLTMFPIERAPEALRGWRDRADAAPDELATACVVLTAPPEPFVPEELRGKPVLGVAALYVGDSRPGCRGGPADPGPPSRCRPHRPHAVHRLPGRPRPARAARLPQLLARRVHEGAQRRGDRHVPRPRRRPDRGKRTLSEMVIFRIGQGVATVPDEAAAFSHRDSKLPVPPDLHVGGPVRRQPDDHNAAAPSPPPCDRSAPAPRTSTSPRSPTASATPTATTSTHASRP